MGHSIHNSTRRRLILPATIGLLALLCAIAGLRGGERADAAAPGAPSFVLIQTDDQTIDSLYETFKPYKGAPAIQAMPNTLRLLADQGMTFNRYYVSYPLCCPSRVTLLTGRYSHNNNVRGNVPPNGGFTGFSFRQAMNHNLATWLQGSGYRTVHVGKLMNGYGEEPFDNGTIVPPGWSAWHTILDVDRTHYGYGYSLNVNGQIQGPFGDSGSWETREYGVRDDITCPFLPVTGPCLHITDHLTSIAANEIAATPPEQPFYVQLDYTAPHGDFRRPAGPEPTPRNYDMFKGAQLPHDRSEGFDEGNVSDKPRFIRDAPHLTPAEKNTYRVYYQKQLDSLRDVDEGVQRIVSTLRKLGRLDNTYVIFLSDNGFFFGEHRLLGGKFLAYEPAVHMPFLIRGPGVKRGAESGELAANIDVAPTILELAGAKADKSIDGRSLVPFIEDPAKRSRRPILFESFVESADVESAGAVSVSGDQSRERNWLRSGKRRPYRAGAPRGNGAQASLLAPPKDYAGIRLGPYKYIAWPSGEKELYNINRDPNELNSLHKVPNFFPIRNFLHRTMLDYTDCVGRACSDVVSEIPLTRAAAQRLRAQKRREIRQRERERERARERARNRRNR